MKLQILLIGACLVLSACASAYKHEEEDDSETVESMEHQFHYAKHDEPHHDDWTEEEEKSHEIERRAVKSQQAQGRGNGQRSQSQGSGSRSNGARKERQRRSPAEQQGQEPPKQGRQQSGQRGQENRHPYGRGDGSGNGGNQRGDRPNQGGDRQTGQGYGNRLSWGNRENSMGSMATMIPPQMPSFANTNNNFNLHGGAFPDFSQFLPQMFGGGSGSGGRGNGRGPQQELNKGGRPNQQGPPPQQQGQQNQQQQPPQQQNQAQIQPVNP